ncbi:MAG: helix-turn-helix domain-containing protein [Treponema sp.]|nr:helix-turn-helix domain-containing protein [Treponema sp.]
MITVFNKTDAAKALRISLRTLNRYKDEGKLPWREIGRRIVFTESDLEKFLDNCAVPATNLPSDREKLEMAKRITGGKRENTA